jgi:uncharacterized membrane protein YdbT with pleckstrin-like domain
MSFFIELVARLLRVPGTPEAPPGDEGTTRVFRASPRYYGYRLLTWALGQTVGVVVFLGVASALSRGSVGLVGGKVSVGVILMLALPFLLLKLLFSYAAVRLDYERRWYLVTDRSLRVREGVQQVREITVSFANIQNVSITQGPIQRLLGIADLRVDTAGGGGMVTVGSQLEPALHAAFFRGVDNAERIRALIQDHLRNVRDTGLGDPDDAHSLHPPAPVQAPVHADETVLAVLRQIRAAARELRASAAVERDPRSAP